MDTVYDRALLEIGHNGVFQKRFDWLYNFLFALLWGMAYMNIFLALVIIPHRCQIPEKTENVSDYSWKLKYIPISSNDSSGKVLFSSCSMYVNTDENNITKACDAYFYDKTWYNSTVPSDNNWVCKNELKVANIFAYSKLGEMIGSIFFGWFGDVYGRRLTYIISLLLLVVGRTISILNSKSFILFAIGCIIAWIPSWSVVQTVTVISMEISTQDRRTTTATLRSTGNGVGMCLMPLLYWWLGNWQTFMIVTTITQLPFLLFSWKMIESPRWLWVRGKMKDCVHELKIIANTNKLRLDSNTEREILTTEAKNNTQAFGPLALFSGWNLAFNTILQSYLWIAVSINYTILVMRSGEKSDGNPFLEFVWQSVAEMPGTLLGAWLADHIGRRYAALASFSLTAFLWIVTIVRENNLVEWFVSGYIGTAMAIANRLSTTASYYVIYLLSMELFPTCLRQSGLSLSNVLSSGASAIAPYLMYLGHHVDSKLPCVILIVVSIFGVMASLLLPETLNAKLPETFEDAKSFGIRNKKYYSIRLKQYKTNNRIQ